MDKPYRVKVKLGNVEFEAEGTEKSVREDLEKVLKSAESRGVTDVQTEIANSKSEETKAASYADTSINDMDIARIFKKDGDLISLVSLPKGKTANLDAILVILWGYSKLQGIQSLSAIQLMKSIKKSGVPITRADRTLKNSEYVAAGGKKRGVQYTINNRGIERAKGLIVELLG